MSEIDPGPPPAAKKPEERTLVRRRSDHYFSKYVGNIGIAVSFFDVRLSIGEIVDDDEDSITVQEDFMLVFTPQHAKVLAGVLAQNVRNYEEQFGEIKIPESMTQPKKRIKGAAEKPVPEQKA